MQPNIERLIEQIRTLSPLVEEVKEHDKAQAVMQSDIKNLKEYKIGEEKITELQLEMAKDQAKYDKSIQEQISNNILANEKQFGIFRNKMVLYAIVEKIILAVIITLAIKGNS